MKNLKEKFHTVSILQSNYLPWKGYFDLIRSSDLFIVFDDAQFTKNSWRNRNRIKTSKGTQWIAIPIQTSGRLEQRVSEAKVVSSEWCASHWAFIKQQYRNAPNFEKFEPLFADLYKQAEMLEGLSQINRLFTQAILKILHIETPIVWSMDIMTIEGKTERLVEICKHFGAKKYLSGPAGQNYMELEHFTQAGIAVEYMDYAHYPAYTQLYGQFVHDVSVLDLIFNEGDDAYLYLDHLSKAKVAA